MLYKICFEEAFALPASLEDNKPIGFTRADATPEEDLSTNLLDIHGHRLRQMDENGIELMVLSLNAPGCQGIADPAQAARLATMANDYVADQVAQNPARFAALAALSMHDPAQAAAELERCLTAKTGFVGALLNDFQSSGTAADAGGAGNTMLFYDDPRYDVFWAAAARLQAPVYLHPRTPTPLIDAQMWRARPWLNLSVLGFANRVNMHLLALITGGVLDRFPALRLVVGHMGEHLPFELYRIDHKLDRARFPAMPMRPDKLVRDYFGDQVFITTSGHFSTPALHCSIAEIGARSILFSIDYPFESIPNACVWFDRIQLNQHDLVDMGRNTCLRLFPRLAQAPHHLQPKSAWECEIGGLRNGETTYGLYNKSFSKRTATS
ncbi:Amidohydrolase 2 [Niveomyces insectorum RCEF 264]|uniref:Amidohydrolase 2 n=1 Tax=Niveomyces insectorum RCEF 264 TaxID=1081102 RepID=A0A167TX81_9HYPO|nr:Amidohydrolase 2 [Niveomyces insectorum RCEF 264]